MGGDKTENVGRVTAANLIAMVPMLLSLSISAQSPLNDSLLVALVSRVLSEQHVDEFSCVNRFNVNIPNQSDILCIGEALRNRGVHLSLVSFKSRPDDSRVPTNFPKHREGVDLITERQARRFERRNSRIALTRAERLESNAVNENSDLELKTIVSIGHPVSLENGTYIISFDLGYYPGDRQRQYCFAEKDSDGHWRCTKLPCDGIS